MLLTEQGNELNQTQSSILTILIALVWKEIITNTNKKHNLLLKVKVKSHYENEEMIKVFEKYGKTEKIKMELADSSSSISFFEYKDEININKALISLKI